MCYKARMSLSVYHEYWASYVASQKGTDAAALAVALAERADWVGRRMADGRKLGVPQSEEGLTESLLLDLRMSFPQLRIRPVGSRNREAQEGHDWEWWIQGPTQWFGARVQAKVQHGAAGAESYLLGYRVGRKKEGTLQPRQVDLVLAAASVRGLPAVYALYNPRDGGVSADPGCPAQTPSGANGVTFVAGETVRMLVDQQAQANGTLGLEVPLASVAAHALPWSCLAACGMYCPRPLSGPVRNDLAASASGFLTGLVRRSGSVFSHRGEDDEAVFASLLAMNDDWGLFGQTPSYVQDIIQEVGSSDDTVSTLAVDAENFPPGTAPSHVVVLPRQDADARDL